MITHGRTRKNTAYYMRSIVEYIAETAVSRTTHMNIKVILQVASVYVYLFVKSLVTDTHTEPILRNRGVITPPYLLAGQRFYAAEGGDEATIKGGMLSPV